MPRSKRGVVSHAKHKKVLKKAKGFYGRRKSTIKVAMQAVDKSLEYSYRDRKKRKIQFRTLWIQRINAAIRSIDNDNMTYSHFISLMKKKSVLINRKILANMAITDPDSFKNLVKYVKNVK